MKGLLLFINAVAVIAAPAALSLRTPEEDAKAAFVQMQQTYLKNTVSLMSGNCNPQNVRVRKSWAALSTMERLNYLNAVKCLNNKPSTLDTNQVPGARTRRDDFTYSHLIGSNFNHGGSGLFFPWHREFIWRYEQALRDECGYLGAHPFWDWAETADDQLKSPVFDGSETSFGSNGAYIPHGVINGTLVNITINGQPVPTTRQPGTGGGCVTDGAFSDFTLGLGPVSPANNTPDNIWGLQYNPRCLTRDVDNSLSSTTLTYSSVMSPMNEPNFTAFQTNIERNMHVSAHGSIGGDLWDFYVSPNDPAFFMLHGNFDRLWTIWQGQDVGARTNAISGTLTTFNSPPSDNATIDSVMNMGSDGGIVRVGDSMSTVSDRLCYIYA